MTVHLDSITSQGLWVISYCSASAVSFYLRGVRYRISDALVSPFARTNPDLMLIQRVNTPEVFLVLGVESKHTDLFPVTYWDQMASNLSGKDTSLSNIFISLFFFWVTSSKYVCVLLLRQVLILILLEQTLGYGFYINMPLWVNGKFKWEISAVIFMKFKASIAF